MFGKFDIRGCLTFGTASVNNCLSFCFAETKKTSETYLPSEFFDNNPDIFNADFFNFLSILVVESSVYEKWYKLKLIEDDGLWNIKKHADKFNKYLEYKDKSSHLVYVECPTKAIEKKDDPIIHRLINNMVKVDDKFAINKYAVSNIEWESIMEYSTRCDESNTDNQPLVEVNWYDCMDFIIELNKRTNLNFRLPTSKEWTKAYEFSNSNRFDKLQEKDEKTFLTKIISFAWFDENSEGKTHPVNETISTIENDHGIKNMLGNVWEWCEDLDAEWGEPERVCRGGSWAVLATDCSVAHYATNSPDYMDNEIGFRLALSISSQE